MADRSTGRPVGNVRFRPEQEDSMKKKKKEERGDGRLRQKRIKGKNTGGE